MATCRLHCAISCMPAWTLVSGRPWSGRFQHLKCWPHRISSHHNRAGFVTAADQTESAGPVSFDKELSKARAAAASRRPRFYIPNSTILAAVPGSVFELNKPETRHALRVLRLKNGHPVELCDGEGRLLEAQMVGLTYSNQAYVEATASAQQVPWTGTKWNVVVAAGALSSSRSDWLVEKLVELGAWSLQPLLTQRSRSLGRDASGSKARVVSVAAQTDDEDDETVAELTSREARWQRVAVAAIKQSLRTHAMSILPPMDMRRLVSAIHEAPLALVAAAGGQPLLPTLSAHQQRLQHACQDAAQPALLIIGPEGDFTGEELAGLVGAGAIPVGLGPHRLRVETASMSVLAASILFADSEP